jgi:pyridinium-3,5-bisthiocarboxylic acid mononucleotide nickel chelatase
MSEHDHDHHHDHDHDGHDHVHAHAHDHDHRHDMDVVIGEPDAAAAQQHRAPLERGAGRGKLLFFDMVSGIAGDMTIAALVDLGVPFSVVEDAVRALGLSGYALELAKASAGAIGATHFDVTVQGDQPHRRYREIAAMIAAAPLDAASKALASKIFLRLAEAEAEVHRTSVDEVAFHEVGAVDAIVDVVGAAACLSFLEARVVASPAPLGRGHVHCAHGTLPLPAPAALLCLRGLPTVDSGLDVELVTPTGAAIIATVAESSTARWPGLVTERVGWGAGTRSLPDRPNALRVVLGEGPGQTQSAQYALLEANVDDMTGELAGHALAILLEAGAIDAWAAPVTMKKGRPGLVLSLLCRAEAAEHLAEVMLRETSSLGVRRSSVTRSERPRRMVEVQTAFGPIPLKVAEGAFGPAQIKPEFDACVRAARAAGVPVREVIAAALAAYRA